ncbi:TPA: hypothetical protein DD449_01680 [Candidatus Berkelbacteria bacterium]|nr:hypothetical protein [Candidatus Berkelbacteria bacterium]
MSSLCLMRKTLLFLRLIQKKLLQKFSNQKNIKMKKFILVGLLFITLALGHFVGNQNNNKNFITEKNPKKNDQEKLPVIKETQEAAIPKEYLIRNVPFISQAPFANWDELHDEACEEASLVIIDYYLSGKDLNADLAEKEIKEQVNWELNFFGSHRDLNTNEVVTLAENYYNMHNLTVKKINSIDDIKKEISQNHLVIVPAAGRDLKNPNYRSPGPIYHMLVVSGYDENHFITQDVGTKRGQNYIYDEDVLFDAIHDWTGTGDTIESGAKNTIIVN